MLLGELPHEGVVFKAQNSKPISRTLRVRACYEHAKQGVILSKSILLHAVFGRKNTGLILFLILFANGNTLFIWFIDWNWSAA